MTEDSVMVNLDISVDGPNVAASMANYAAKVVEGMQIIWNITIRWPTISQMPSGEVTVEIPRFKNITPGNEELFANYTPDTIVMEAVIGQPVLTAVFESPVVKTSTPPPPPPFLWQWEYFIKISLETISGLSHFKIDPLVVISG